MKNLVKNEVDKLVRNKVEKYIESYFNTLDRKLDAGAYLVREQITEFGELDIELEKDFYLENLGNICIVNIRNRGRNKKDVFSYTASIDLDNDSFVSDMNMGDNLDRDIVLEGVSGLLL